MKHLIGIFLLLFFGAAFYGCEPDPVYPNEPALKFKEFRPQRAGSDSLTAVFSFTDGDGDIGVAPTDPDSNFLMTVYVPDASMNYHVLDNSQTSQSDSIYYSYRISHLTAGQAGLEGDIYVTILHKSFIGRDTLQFNAFLLDQSHHRSNYVRTDPVVLTH